jgi:integrase
VSGASERVHLRGLGSYFRRRAGWWIAYHVNGRQFRDSVAKRLGKPPQETTRADAERCLRAAVRRPTAPRTRSAARETVTGVLDRYLVAVKGRKSFTDIRNECQLLKASLGPLLADGIDRAVLTEYYDQAIAAGFAPGTVKKRLSYLRAALYCAHEAGTITRMPPWPTLADSPPREGFYDPDDFAARLAHVPPGAIADVLEFFYLTGWRRNELLELEWSRIDRLTRQVRLPVLNDKTGHGRVVPLDDVMWAIIERRWAERTTRRGDGRVLVSRWVFHGPLGGRLNEDSVYRVWYAACDAAGLPRRFLHDFRRTVARDAIQGGASEKVAMQMDRPQNRLHLQALPDHRHPGCSARSGGDGRLPRRGAPARPRLGR